MKLVSNFNDRFKEAFKDRSVTEFANEIGVSKQAVSAYLNGVRKPKKIVAEAIARQLNVSPAWLLGYDVPMDYQPDFSKSVEQEKRNAEFVSLFSQLSVEQQKMVIAQIKGILSEQA